MMFCPKCGSILMPKAEKDKKIISCGCGYKSDSAELKIKVRSAKEKETKLDVVEKEEEVHSSAEQKCPKCGHEKAYYWEIQMRAADEPATLFFRCQKCRHTWRH